MTDNIPLNQKDKEHGRWTGTPAKDNSLEKKKCFNCGSTDHLAKDKECPGNSQGKKITTQMYMAREIVQEDEERDGQEDLPEGSEEEEDNDKSNIKDKPYEGLQYSSEGEDIDLEDLKSQDDKDEDNKRVRFHTLYMDW